MEKSKKYRFGWGIFLIWLVVAGIADALTLIPFVGLMMGPTYWIIFSLYLYKTGHGLFEWKSLTTKGVSVAAEIIPFVQALPTMAICTIIVFAISRTEDRTGINIKSIAGSRLPKKTPPLNKDGVRLPRNTEDENDDFSTPSQMPA